MALTQFWASSSEEVGRLGTWKRICSYHPLEQFGRINSNLVFSRTVQNSGPYLNHLGLLVFYFFLNGTCALDDMSLSNFSSQLLSVSIFLKCFSLSSYEQCLKLTLAFLNPKNLADITQPADIFVSLLPLLSQLLQRVNLAVLLVVQHQIKKLIYCELLKMEDD